MFAVRALLFRLNVLFPKFPKFELKYPVSSIKVWIHLLIRCRDLEIEKQIMWICHQTDDALCVGYLHLIEFKTQWHSCGKTINQQNGNRKSTLLHFEWWIQMTKPFNCHTSFWYYSITLPKMFCWNYMKWNIARVGDWRSHSPLMTPNGNCKKPICSHIQVSCLDSSSLCR